MEKLLTVSVAAYNVEQYLRETLQSLVLPELMDRYEVLIEDDGSTDGTAAVGMEFQEKYPDCFRVIRKENGGYGSTINRSIKEARGVYFRQLDGDDWYDREGFAAFLRELPEIEADCVLTAFIRFTEGDGKKVTVDYSEGIPSGCRKLDGLHFQNLLNMHSVTFRTEILRKMPHRITEHCFYTDLEFVSFPLPLVETVYITHHPVYIYRIGREGQSVSAAGIRKHYREHARVVGHLLKEFRNLPQERETLKDLFVKRLRVEVTAHLKYLCLLKPSRETGREFTQFAQRILRNDPEIAAAVSAYSRFARAVMKAKGRGYLFFRTWYWLTEGRGKQ